MALEYIMGAMKSQWLSIKLSHIRERYSQKRSPWWTTGRTKKKIYNKNNNTYYRPWSIITDMTGMENRCMAIKKILTFPLDFTWKHLHLITDAFFSCSFLKNIYNHTTKKRSTSMSFKYDIDIEKDEKYWIQVLTLFSFFTLLFSFC